MPLIAHQAPLAATCQRHAMKRSCHHIATGMWQQARSRLKRSDDPYADHLDERQCISIRNYHPTPLTFPLTHIPLRPDRPIRPPQRRASLVFPKHRRISSRSTRHKRTTPSLIARFHIHLVPPLPSGAGLSRPSTYTSFIRTWGRTRAHGHYPAPAWMV